MSPNDFGKKFLTTQCRQIKIIDFVKESRQQLLEALLNASLEANGYEIRLCRSKTGFGGTRFWFSCPICGGRAGVLYKHPVSQILGCRRCLRLDYRKHRYHKMVENGGK